MKDRTSNPKPSVGNKFVYYAILPVICILLIALGWYAVIHQTQVLTQTAIVVYQQTELEIVRAAARSVEEYVHEQTEVHDRTDVVEIEQEIFQRFIAPIRLLEHGDAWIYAPDHVVFDLSTDFPDEYKGKSMAEIFALQVENGASHYEEMTDAVTNAREGVGWYIWLPDKGKEVAAWTPVHVGEHIWTIGLSTPLPEIMASTGATRQTQALIAATGVGTCIALGLLLAWGYGSVQRQRAEKEIQERSRELAERTRELAEHTRELEASQRVTFAASERVAPDELLGLVVDLIRDQFNLYHVQVYVVDEERKAAVLRQSTGYAGRQLLQREHHIPLDRTALVTKAIREGKPVLVDDTNQDPNFTPNPLLPETQSELAVPLKVGDKVIGVLDAQDRTPGRFTENTVALFQTMAGQIAFLFENSELLARITEQTEALTIFTTQLRTAADIAERMGTILDPDLLLQQVVELMQSRFGLYHTHIYVLDEATRQLTVRAGSGEVGRVLKERGHSIPLDREKSLVARAARTQEIVSVPDTSLASGFMPNPLLPQTRSEVSVPLVAGEKVMGVLDVQDNQPGRFTQSDLDTFSTLAGQIAIALQNAEFVEEIRQTTERLREVDRLKSEFLASMSHELRTPLNSIIGYTEIMLMGIDGTMATETLKDVQAIYDNSQHLLRIINDVLDLARIEAGRLKLDVAEVSVEKLVEAASSSVEGLLVDTPIEFNVEIEEELPTIWGDRVRLNQIINNLTSNAAKFTREGHITLRAFSDDGWVCIEVKDTGIGVSEENQEKIFERFQQLNQTITRQQEGTGLGLAITRELVQLHGGTIGVQSRFGEGSTFTVRLPVRRVENRE